MSGYFPTRSGARVRVRVVLVAALALAITGTGSLPLAAAASGGALVRRTVALLDVGLGYFTPIAPLLRELEGSQAISRGKDGRLTILLLGSDYRPGGGGDRTDTIMVVTINPKNKEAAALSIPRDTGNVPLPNGTIFKPKINGLLKAYRKATGLTAEASMTKALPQLTAAIAHILKIEIDYYALIRFDGVESLVDHVGGVSVRIDKDWFDPKFPGSSNPPGSYFPVSGAWKLYGKSAPVCRGWYRYGSYKGQSGYYCQRALVYARSRKGTGNNDFVRAGRQQRLVEAAARKVLARGKSSNLSALVNAGKGQVGIKQVWTNIPLTSANAVELYNLLNGFKLMRTVVLKPTTYAKKIPGTSKYELKLDVVRSLTKSWFGPVN